MKIRKFQFGFTLVELLVAVGIVALLSAAAVTSYRSANIRSRDARRRADLEQIRAALEMHRTDQGTYPSGTFATMVSTLSSGSYLNNSINDPLSSPYPQYTYTTSAPFTTYTLCATLENPPSTSYCLQNP